jgi:hypothetical protein
MLFIGNVRERLSLVALDADGYASTLQNCAARGVVGGSVYDALLAQCALKANAQTIYTWTFDTSRYAATKLFAGYGRRKHAPSQRSETRTSIRYFDAALGFGRTSVRRIMG